MIDQGLRCLSLFSNNHQFLNFCELPSIFILIILHISRLIHEILLLPDSNTSSLNEKASRLYGVSIDPVGKLKTPDFMVFKSILDKT